jgi:hypothetical protein
VACRKLFAPPIECPQTRHWVPGGVLLRADARGWTAPIWCAASPARCLAAPKAAVIRHFRTQKPRGLAVSGVGHGSLKWCPSSFTPLQGDMRQASERARRALTSLTGAVGCGMINVVSCLHCMNDPEPEGHMASHIERRKFLARLGGAAATGGARPPRIVS